MKFRPIYLFASLSLLVGAATPFAIANASKLASPVLAQNPLNPTGGSEKGWRKSGKSQKMDQLIQSLNLTPEQTNRIKALQDQARQDASNERQQLRTEMEQMQSLMARSASVSELRQQHDKIQSLQRELGDRRFENMLAMYEVLTPEQRSRFAEVMQQHRGRERERKAPQLKPELQ